MLICLGIFGAGAGVLALVYSTEPTAAREGARKKTAMLVRLAEAERGTFSPRLTSLGTVRPAREVVLRAQVSGEVVEVSEHLVPGGFVADGEQLLRIDPADYRAALRQREAELAQARAELQIEGGRQKVARRELERFEGAAGDANEALMLRQPQLAAAKARVDFARAATDRARRDLERTRILAPYEAQILSRMIELGSRVERGDALARIADVGTYWVEATVPVADLQWLAFPDESGAGGASARVRHRGAWPEGAWRIGRLFRLIGELDDQTRMARVLVAVDDPLGRAEGAPEVPPLMLGAFVEVQIEGRPLVDVVRVSRGHVRKNGTVWVMKDGALDIRRVGIVLRDERHAYVREGLEGSERIVASDLARVVPGAPLREVEAE
jgi:RND family efflux transporter MFP subunit